jgi:hypothetical protein
VICIRFQVKGGRSQEAARSKQNSWLLKMVIVQLNICGAARCRGNDQGSPPPIGRMIWVERPTIESNIRAKTARLDEPLRAVMTSLAERLERPEPEFVDIAPMRIDMVADSRGHNDAALRTILTKRVFEQLVVPDPSPACRGVPAVISLRLAVKAHNIQSFI